MNKAMNLNMPWAEYIHNRYNRQVQTYEVMQKSSSEENDRMCHNEQSSVSERSKSKARKATMIAVDLDNLAPASHADRTNQNAMNLRSKSSSRLVQLSASKIRICYRLYFDIAIMNS